MVCWVGTNILDKHWNKSAKLQCYNLEQGLPIYDTRAQSHTQDLLHAQILLCPKISLPELAITHGGHTQIQEGRLGTVITTTE